MPGPGGRQRLRRRAVDSAIAGVVAMAVTWHTAPLLAPVVAAATRAETASASVAPHPAAPAPAAQPPTAVAAAAGVDGNRHDDVASGTAAGPRFRITATDDAGRPVGFDACRTIGYVIHLGPGSPPDATGLAHEAIAIVGEATGLRFAFEGFTAETFGARMDALDDRERQHSVRPPVLVSFEPPDGTNHLGSDAGRGAPEFWIADRAQIASGAVVVNTADPWIVGGSSADGLRAALLHELGHVVGLGHAGAGQLMAPVLDPTRVATFQAGDLEGLAQVGRSTTCPASTESS